MFVCNKIDTSAEAKQFDYSRDSAESDSEGEETTTEFDKQRTVFSQLQKNGLIDDNDSFETCGCFYGISAHDVRVERLNKRGGKATEAFARFEEGLLAILDETVKLQAKQVVSKLILLQMTLVQAMKRTRQALTGTLFGSSLDYDAAKSIRKSLHSALIDLSQLSDFTSTKTSKQMEEMVTLYVPAVTHLVVKTLALQFLLTKGPLLLGPVLKVTKHGQLHECAGWADESTSGACVVKVIKEEEVEAEVWAQTSIDLFNTM